MAVSKETNVRDALNTLSAVAANKDLLAALEQAAGSRASWTQAKKNPKALLRRHKITLPRGVSVSFEDARRGSLGATAKVVMRCLRICIRLGPYFLCITICVVRRIIE